MVDAAPWQALFDEFEGYITLQQIFQRLARIATIIKEFSANTAKLPENTEAHRLVKQRIGQEIFRESLMDYWGGRCSATGLDMPELLRASHIKPWAKCETDVERLDVFNGLLLAPQLDALFDGGWVTFTLEGELIISNAVKAECRDLLGLNGVEGIPRLTDSHQAYLTWHRENLFRR